MMQQQMLPYRFLGWLKNNCNEDNPSVTPLVGEIHTDIIRSHRCGVFGKSLWGWELQCADRGCNTGSLGVIRVPALRLSDASCFGRVTLFGVSYTVMCIYSSCTLHFMCWVKLLCYRKEKRKKKNTSEILERILQVLHALFLSLWNPILATGFNQLSVYSERDINPLPLKTDLILDMDSELSLGYLTLLEISHVRVGTYITPSTQY